MDAEGRLLRAIAAALGWSAGDVLPPAERAGTRHATRCLGSEDRCASD